MDKKNNTSKTVIGITGGIASGKTVATNALAAVGYTVIDADEISRALTAQGTPAEAEIMRMFPAAKRNGVLDRRRLRDMIASDVSARNRLNGYTHPLIRREIEKQILEAADARIVLSAPLLFECGLETLCKAVVCVTCPTAARIDRLVLRDGVDENSAAAMIRAQLSDSERTARSDRVISSDCPLAEFEKEVTKLFGELFDAHSANG